MAASWPWSSQGRDLGPVALPSEVATKVRGSRIPLLLRRSGPTYYRSNGTGRAHNSPIPGPGSGFLPLLI